MQGNEKTSYTSMLLYMMFNSFIHLLANSIEQDIAKSETQMLFNINSNTPVYAFISAVVSVCHIQNLQLRFYNSIYNVKYIIEMLTNNAILPAMFSPPNYIKSLI